MDEFKDFFKELKERATSPFFGSFIISWCLINWPIIIAILFENNQKEKDRFTFVYEKIVSHDNFFSFFVFPFIIAVAYTAFYPWVRRKIKVHIAKQQAFGDSEILKQTGIASVSLENYITMVQAQDSARNNLATLMNSQEAINEKLKKVEADRDKAQVELIAMTSTLKLRDQSLQDRKRFSEMTPYLGHWYFYLKVDANFVEFPWYIDLDYISINLLSHGIHAFISDYENRFVVFSIYSDRPMEDGVRVRVQNFEVFKNNVGISTFIFEVEEGMQTLTSLRNSPVEYLLVRNRIQINEI